MKRRQDVLRRDYWAQRVGAWFPDRQIILRTDSQIRYLKVSKNFQLASLAVLALALGWGIFTSTTYFAFNDILRSKDAQISASHDNYQNLLGEVSQYQARFSVLTKELQKNHAMMLDLVENNATLQLNLRSTQKNLETSQAKQAEIDTARTNLRDKLTSIETELGSMTSRNFELKGNLNTMTNHLQTAMSERAEMQIANQALQGQVAQLEAEVSRLHQTETEVIARLAKRTQDGIVFMERVFARAGLDADEFLEQIAMNANATGGDAPVGSREDEAEPADDSSEQAASDEELAVEAAELQEKETDEAPQAPGIEMLIARRPVPTAQGGPFIATTPMVPLPQSGEKLKASLSSLEERLGRWDELRQLMRTAPLPSPLDQFQLSSSFGKRRDPIRQRWAMHYGLDLRAPLNSMVYATAPGVVTVASVQNDYGRLIEIDHGMGFKTRYAHLNKILVRVGQKVEYRDNIGLLGNSGRSTGPHLHYEIAHNGRPVDPMRFLKAGKYVYKGQ
jgi:murein DD-endopeptidase MepM/ murein hydrolase activator NlpD